MILPSLCISDFEMATFRNFERKDAETQSL